MIRPSTSCGPAHTSTSRLGGVKDPFVLLQIHRTSRPKCDSLYRHLHFFSGRQLHITEYLLGRDIAYDVEVLADTCLLGGERLKQQADIHKGGDIGVSRVEVSQGETG